MSSENNDENKETTEQETRSKIEVDALPTWTDIFFAAAPPWINPSRSSKTLEMMSAIEDAGHGDSVERELLNLILNYGFGMVDLKSRVLDMLYGPYVKMYSYQGWETLTTTESVRYTSKTLKGVKK